MVEFFQTIDSRVKYFEEQIKNLKCSDSFRHSLGELCLYLEKKNYFFTAPASGKYHMNIEGGLFKHSYLVYENLKRICEQFNAPYKDDTIFLVGWFHDLHKADDSFGNCQYLEEDNDWVRKKYGQNYKFNPEVFSFNLEVKTILTLSRYFELSRHELQALAYHHLGFNENIKDIRSNVYPLTIYLHCADLITAQIEEKEYL